MRALQTALARSPGTSYWQLTTIPLRPTAEAVHVRSCRDGCMVLPFIDTSGSTRLNNTCKRGCARVGCGRGVRAPCACQPLTTEGDGNEEHTQFKGPYSYGKRPPWRKEWSESHFQMIWQKYGEHTKPIFLGQSVLCKDDGCICSSARRGWREGNLSEALHKQIN
eukprot:1161806-Pelagomonas_calceolata.AAC.1